MIIALEDEGHQDHAQREGGSQSGGYHVNTVFSTGLLESFSPQDDSISPRLTQGRVQNFVATSFHFWLFATRKTIEESRVDDSKRKEIL
jgi:hypothetical protein